MYEIKNCKICGKVYQSVASKDVCPNCEEKNNFCFDKIRNYLYSHPRANIFEVVSVLDVPLSMIKHFLREYRLEIVEKENNFLSCEICGQSIQSGRYCDECFKKVSHGYKVICTDKLQNKSSQRLNYYQPKIAGKAAL